MVRVLLLDVLALGAVLSLDYALPSPDGLRIFGGLTISIEDAPFMAALYIRRKNNRTYFCGGSIINERFILTAAHCLRDTHSIVSRSVTGFVGAENRYDPNQIQIVSEHKLCHESYDSRNDLNDICLIKLKTPLKFGRKVGRVTLPYEDFDLEEGTYVNITGWGLTGDSSTVQTALRQVPVPIMKYCRINRKTVFCTGSEGRATCQADSGGPVSYGRVLVGVISGGLSNRCGHMGSYHTRVASYVQWIKTTIRHNSY